MATETTNYHFIKPGDADPVDNTPLNQNFDSIDAAIADHVADTNNPHQVTKEQVGLGNVDNVATKDVLAELVDAGAKNLLKITATSQTINGVTFTVSDDGTVTVNGTNTGTSSVTFILVPNQQAILIPDGDYWFLGCPQGGGTNTFGLRWFRYSPNASAYDTGSGAAVHKSGNTTDSNIAIVVKSGVTVNNIMFTPMLCTSEDYAISPEFVPYAPTNRELYDEVQAKITKSEVYNRGTAISTGDDLNNYTSFGKFYAATGAIATSLTNCPITTGFVMTVEDSFQAGKMQTLVTIESGGNATVTYRRSQVYRSNVWSWLPWYKFEGTVVT